MKDSWTESRRIFNTFVSATVVTIGFMLIAMGIFAANNNTMMIDSGISPAMIYAQRENRQISVQIGEQLFESEPPKEIPLKELARLAPAPINGIYNIYENVYSLIKRQL